MTQPKSLIGPVEAGRILGLSDDTVYRYAQEGLIPVASVTLKGRFRRFERRVIEALAERQRELVPATLLNSRATVARVAPEEEEPAEREATRLALERAIAAGESGKARPRRARARLRWKGHAR